MTDRWTPREKLAGWVAGAMLVLVLTVMVNEQIQDTRERAQASAERAVLRSEVNALQAWIAAHSGDSGRGDGTLHR